MDLQTGVAVWLGVIVALVLVQRTQMTLGVGLVLAYIINLSLIHLPGALLYLDPDYAYYKREWIEWGFEQSSFAVLAFGIGAAATFWFLHQTRRDVPASGDPSQVVLPNLWLHRFYFLFGLFSFFVIQPFLRGIPTISAVAGVLNQLLLLGICLGMWHAWHTRNWLALGLWTGALGLLPVMTIVFQGFIGFGTAALLTGLAFLASFFRPRLLIFVVGILFVFVALSAFITYFRDRTEIRRVVWGNETLEERIEQFGQTFGDFEWIDPSNRRHLNYIDERLNQNWLVGAAVENLARGKVDFKNGATMGEAVIALVPRAIWPDKPARAGSGNLVTDATGISFDATTSIGVGQVLEFYFNFGSAGVIVGGFVWGIALAALDVNASRALILGNVRRFTLFYLIGLGMIQPGGSLVDVVGTSAAAALAAIVINEFLVPFFVGPFQEDTAAGAAPKANELQRAES